MNAPGERLDASTLASLEFEAVVDLVAARATCAPGQASVRALRPGEIARAEEDLALVDDAVALLQSGTDIGFGGVVDVVDAVERGALGSTLSGAELRAIAHSERALATAVDLVRRPRRDVEGDVAVDLHGRPPRPLLSLASRRQNTDALMRRLESAVQDDGTLADSASAELGRLRRAQRALSEEIRRRVDDIVRRPTTAKLLSEGIVTMRDGRYVVPVRADAAPQFAGVVHGQSASGATVFIEPMACVEANNRLRGLEADEEREIARVLAELSALVGAAADAIAAHAVLVARLDAIFARGRWAISARAISPRLVDGQMVRIVRGRHPLLRHEAVALDVSFGDEADAIVISGPNMGGKTVVLKTIGLFCALAYAGIPLPCAAGTEMGAFEHIACVIGDDQSIADDLSSFSAHLRALQHALRRAGASSLVLVDEIGSGTEPGAGAALAQAVIEALLTTGAKVVVTTHYTQLKIFAASRPRVMNASMLFEAATHAPTYELAMGVPGQSLAFALANTIGMDATTIGRAQELLGADSQNLERAFEGLAAERERFRAEAQAQEAELARLRGLETDLRDEVRRAEADRTAFERKAADALERAIREARDELTARAARSEGDARRQRARSAADAEDALKKTMAEIRRSLGLEGSKAAEAAPKAYAVGDRVYVKSFGRTGVVSELYDRDVLVTIGSVRALVSRRDITRDPALLDPASDNTLSRNASAADPRLASLDASTSIDVRGMRVDEAMPVVDKALDDASLAGLAVLRIIHGKGTGQLGRGLREMLKGHAQVQTAEFAPDREGGTGVTVVTLR